MADDPEPPSRPPDEPPPPPQAADAPAAARPDDPRPAAGAAAGKSSTASAAAPGNESAAAAEPATAEAAPPDAAAAAAAKVEAAKAAAAKVAAAKAAAAGGSAAAPKPPPARPAAGAAAAPKAAPAAKAAHEPPKAAPPSGPPDPPPPADVPVPAYIAGLQAAIPGAVSALSYYLGDWTVIVAAEHLLGAAGHLRDAPDAHFDYCSDLTATDWPPRAERFDVLYMLYSTRHRHRVRVKVKVAEHQPLPSVTGIWLATDWLEREVYDMFGVNITGHPDRRRILMPEDWQGYPQRKDYPLEGPGELLMENPIDWLKLRQAREEADIE